MPSGTSSAADSTMSRNRASCRARMTISGFSVITTAGRPAPGWRPSSTRPTSTRTAACMSTTSTGQPSTRSRRPKYSLDGRLLTITAPSPGTMRTRATAVLRRPVAWCGVSAAGDNDDLSQFTESDRLWLLRLVAVLRSRVDTEPLELVGAEGVVLKHAAHRVHDRERPVAGDGLLERAHAPAAGITRVAIVRLQGPLAAGDDDVARIDDDDVLAGVHVRRVLGAVLAAQHPCDVGGEPSQRLAARIDDEPARFHLSRLG